jgi:hypothetical protein
MNNTISKTKDLDKKGIWMRGTTEFAGRIPPKRWTWRQAVGAIVMTGLFIVGLILYDFFLNIILN